MNGLKRVRIGKKGVVKGNFHIHTVHLHIIKVFYSPTDVQLNCLKNNFKIYIKIGIKTAPTYFGAISIIRERIVRAC
jgi:hypothetical protein